MTDETAVNRAIQSKAQWLGENWRMWAPWTASAVIATASAAYAWHSANASKQADNAVLVSTVNDLVDEMKGFRKDLVVVQQNQAADHATLNAVSSDVHDIKTFKDKAQQVADEFKDPRLNKGHRAEH